MGTAGPASIRSFWLSLNGLVLAAALITGGVAWWLIAWPVVSLANATAHEGHFAQVYGHMVGGTAMLVLGGINIFLGATRRAMPLHRLAGRAYIILGVPATVLAIIITLSPAHKAASGPVVTNASISLTMLGIGWIAAVAMGWRAIRNQRYPAHRDWMIRSYVLVWSFVFCRLASRVPEIGGLGGGEAFIWLSWIVPLMLCEIALQWRAGSRSVSP